MWFYRRWNDFSRKAGWVRPRSVNWSVVVWVVGYLGSGREVLLNAHLTAVAPVVGGISFRKSPVWSPESRLTALGAAKHTLKLQRRDAWRRSTLDVGRTEVLFWSFSWACKKWNLTLWGQFSQGRQTAPSQISVACFKTQRCYSFSVEPSAEGDFKPNGYIWQNRKPLKTRFAVGMRLVTISIFTYTSYGKGVFGVNVL